MRIEFPYPSTTLDIPPANLMGIYSLPAVAPVEDEETVVQRALATPSAHRACVRSLGAGAPPSSSATTSRVLLPPIR